MYLHFNSAFIRNDQSVVSKRTMLRWQRLTSSTDHRSNVEVNFSIFKVFLDGNRANMSSHLHPSKMLIKSVWVSNPLI